jgi:hypothetical protein
MELINMYSPLYILFNNRVFIFETWNIFVVTLYKITGLNYRAAAHAHSMNTAETCSQYTYM